MEFKIQWHFSFTVPHLPKNLDFGARNDVIFKVTTFQLQIRKARWMCLLFAISTVSRYQLFIANYVIVCA